MTLASLIGFGVNASMFLIATRLALFLSLYERVAASLLKDQSGMALSNNGIDF
jgi:hypothetical protein